MLLALIEKLVDGYFARRPRRRPVANLCKHAVLIAHRGAHNNAQGLFENTLAAFQIAKEVGCWGIEFDVQATADGVLVVNHDPTLLRLWGHDVTITEIKFSELRALVPGVPSLAEVIAQYGKDLHLFIELKAPFSAEDALVQNLQGLTPVADYHLLSLDAPIFAQLKHFTKQALLLVAVHNNTRHFCDLSLAENYAGVLGHYLLFTDRQLARLQQRQQLTGVGFVDSKYSLYRELQRGIRYIFTNQAAEMMPHLNRLQNERSADNSAN